MIPCARIYRYGDTRNVYVTLGWREYGVRLMRAKNVGLLKWQVPEGTLGKNMGNLLEERSQCFLTLGDAREWVRMSARYELQALDAELPVMLERQTELRRLLEDPTWPPP